MSTQRTLKELSENNSKAEKAGGIGNGSQVVRETLLFALVLKKDMITKIFSL